MRKYVFFFLMLNITGVAQELGARYLIITHDNFYNAIQPLAEWKHRKGMRAKVAKLSQIGSSAYEIHNYVQTAFNTWQVRPEFLLLVGAPNYLPFGSNYSDNYYTNMDADIFNEVLSGRLTVHDASEAQTVVNKILLYEKTPDLSDSLWFIDACLIVREEYDYYDDSIYWDDINHAKNLMLNNGYNFMDTLSRFAGDNAYDVISSVNQGRAFVLYRGSGVNNWYSPFGVNPDQTANGSRLPIVLSITCRTIGTGSTPASAERWLLTGAPTSPRGAAGYFATTTTGIGVSHLRSAVCKGFFNGLFQQGRKTFGEACEAGRMNVYNLYNSSSEYRGFTTLGDPEMNIWTAIPEPLEVFHDSLLSVGEEWLAVSVRSLTVPVESALVCIILDTLIYEYGYTTNEGEITLNLETLIPGYMYVTVTAKNKIPYVDSILVVSTHVEETKELSIGSFLNLSVSPNPFTNSTDIRYWMTDNRQKYALKIYDITGRLVSDLSRQISVIGYQASVRWDGCDNMGNRLPAGVYFVQGLTSEETLTVPVLVVR
jgi:hypothetical protein